jgi:hypothetical protein
MLALCGEFAMTLALSVYLVLVHQSGDPVLATLYALALQNSMNAWTAIGLAAIAMDFPDLHQQCLVCLCPGTWSALPPGIVPSD